MSDVRRTSDCCGGVSPESLSVHEYFERGYCRSRDSLPACHGDIVRGSGKLRAQFFLNVLDDRIQAASYSCSTCVVLIVYCERLAEMVSALLPIEAIEITPELVIREFPEVLPYKHDRAYLAVEALHSALRRAASGAPENCHIQKSST